MVFLLAIPSREAGSTHMQLLTTLTTSLTDDETRSNLLAASTREEVLSILGVRRKRLYHLQCLPHRLTTHWFQ
jgi:2-O-A-mannosyl-D-glycerate-specific PTS system IIC component